MKTLAITLIAALVTTGASLSASEELARAKELYRAAAYDEALAVLDQIPAPGNGPDTLEAREYRVLCLVALGRGDDAQQAIAALVTAAPDYRMSEERTSPRVRALFAEIRRSVLPSLVQQAYADARAAFDRKEPDAVARFDRVLALLKDPDALAAPGLSGLATVASGFRDLARAHAAAVAEPPPVMAAAPAVADTVTRTTAAPAAAATIIPPVAVAQTIPPMLMREQREWTGEVEVVINETGKVVSARMSKPVHPLYDAHLLRAARGWTYKPALKDGIPTQTLKLVSVHIDSRPACSPEITANCRPATPE